jgi:cytochrome P450
MTTTASGRGTTASGPGATAPPTIDYDYTLVRPVNFHQDELDELRARHPFFKSSWAQGFWVLTRLDAIRDAFQDPRTFSSSAIVAYEPEPPYMWIPEQLDPPIHTKWRQLLASRFSPGSINRMEDQVRQRCVELVETFADRGRVDFLREFARKYPTSIFMELMGLPKEEAERFMAWEDEILHLPSDADPGRARAYTAMNEVNAYFAELIEARAAQPRDDLVSEALTWRIDGEPIPTDSLLSFCLLMFMAGLDTVTIQLSYSWWHLATHDEDRRRIVADPSVIPSAIEELLRYYAFVAPSRKVTADVEHHGCPLKMGDMVLLPLCAATRDPDAFVDADKVLIDRQINNHVAFGVGPHRCLGSHLARRELKVAMEEWHKRIPDYRLPEGAEILQHGGMFGIDNLELVW